MNYTPTYSNQVLLSMSFFGYEHCCCWLAFNCTRETRLAFSRGVCNLLDWVEYATASKYHHQSFFVLFYLALSIFVFIVVAVVFVAAFFAIHVLYTLGHLFFSPISVELYCAFLMICKQATTQLHSFSVSYNGDEYRVSRNKHNNNNNPEWSNHNCMSHWIFVKYINKKKV